MLLEGYVSNLDDENDKIYRLNELIKQNAQRNLAKRAEWEQRHPIISEIQKSYQPRIGAIPSYNGQVAEWENQAKYGLQAPIKEQFKQEIITTEFICNIVINDKISNYFHFSNLSFEIIYYTYLLLTVLIYNQHI